MRSFTTIGLLLVAASAYGVAPNAPEALFVTSTKTPIEYVSHKTEHCTASEQFPSTEPEATSPDLLMGVLLAAKETGMEIHVVEEVSCFAR